MPIIRDQRCLTQSRPMFGAVLPTLELIPSARPTEDTSALTANSACVSPTQRVEAVITEVPPVSWTWQESALTMPWGISNGRSATARRQASIATPHRTPSRRIDYTQADVWIGNPRGQVPPLFDGQPKRVSWYMGSERRSNPTIGFRGLA